jgi:hypothetical protein
MLIYSNSTKPRHYIEKITAPYDSAAYRTPVCEISLGYCPY